MFLAVFLLSVRCMRAGLLRAIVGFVMLSLMPVSCAALSLGANVSAVVIGEGFLGWRAVEVPHHATETAAAGAEHIVVDTVSAVEDGVRSALMTGNLILFLCGMQVVLPSAEAAWRRGSSAVHLGYFDQGAVVRIGFGCRGLTARVPMARALAVDRRLRFQLT